MKSLQNKKYFRLIIGVLTVIAIIVIWSFPWKSVSEESIINKALLIGIVIIAVIFLFLKTKYLKRTKPDIKKIQEEIKKTNHPLYFMDIKKIKISKMIVGIFGLTIFVVGPIFLFVFEIKFGVWIMLFAFFSAILAIFGDYIYILHKIKKAYLGVILIIIFLSATILAPLMARDVYLKESIWSTLIIILWALSFIISAIHYAYLNAKYILPGYEVKREK